MFDDDGKRPLPRKRKSKISPAQQTLDLNIPLGESNVIVLVGLVNSRVSQSDIAGDNSGGSMIETLKKQKRSNTQNARSAMAAKAAPTGHNESPMRELPGLRAARDSSRTPPVGGGKEVHCGLFDGDKDGRGACPWLEKRPWFR